MYDKTGFLLLYMTTDFLLQLFAAYDKQFDYIGYNVNLEKYYFLMAVVIIEIRKCILECLSFDFNKIIQYQLGSIYRRFIRFVFHYKKKPTFARNFVCGLFSKIKNILCAQSHWKRSEIARDLPDECSAAASVKTAQKISKADSE